MIDFDNRPWGRWEEFIFEPVTGLSDLSFSLREIVTAASPLTNRGLGYC